jgi:hypothetical protein
MRRVPVPASGTTTSRRGGLAVTAFGRRRCRDRCAAPGRSPSPQARLRAAAPASVPEALSRPRPHAAGRIEDQRFLIAGRLAHVGQALDHPVAARRVRGRAASGGSCRRWLAAGEEAGLRSCARAASATPGWRAVAITCSRADSVRRCWWKALSGRGDRWRAGSPHEAGEQRTRPARRQGDGGRPDRELQARFLSGASGPGPWNGSVVRTHDTAARGSHV